MLRFALTGLEDSAIADYVRLSVYNATGLSLELEARGQELLAAGVNKPARPRQSMLAILKMDAS